MTSSSPWIVLAHLLRPQGRKGELLAELLTDFPERFKEQKRVFLAKPDFVGEAAEARSVEVVSFWLPLGKNEGRIVLALSGIDSISEAEAVAGYEVVIPQQERLPLDDDSNYISELVGCTVYDRGVVVGMVDDVQFPTTSDGSRRLVDAAPLLAVTSPAGDEVLIPFAKDFLIEIDIAAQRIEMNLPPGLVEVNLPATGEAASDQKR